MKNYFAASRLHFIGTWKVRLIRKTDQADMTIPWYLANSFTHCLPLDFA